MDLCAIEFDPVLRERDNPSWMDEARKGLEEKARESVEGGAEIYRKV